MSESEETYSDIGENDNNLMDQDGRIGLMEECEEVARVTFREGGDDFSPKIRAETFKRPITSPLKKTLPPQKFSKCALSVCSVPGCKSKYLVQMGVKLTGFQVPHHSNTSFEKVWMKWIHALGYSSSEEASKICNFWAKICELHFTEDCITMTESTMKGKRIRLQKRLLPGSFPTLNIPVPEIVLEDPRLIFRLDPIIGKSDTLDLNPSDRISHSEKVQMCKTIVAEAEELVLKELNRSVKPSVIPPSILERSKDQYQNRLKQLLKEAELENPPSFVDGLISKLGLEPEPEMDTASPSELPPCTILKPVAKEGEAALPAILLPGIDHEKAIELLEDDNVQNLLKSLAEKHRDEMLAKFSEGEEGEIQERDENGLVTKTVPKIAIPPPPPIILQATELCTNESQNPLVPDIVQQAIDKTFHEQQSARKAKQLAAQRKLSRLPYSLTSRNSTGEQVNSPGDHDYQQSLRNSHFSTFDPTGLRQEVERWRLEVESLRQKNCELKFKLQDAKYTFRATGFKSHGIVSDEKKLEKLEAINQKMTEELVRLKLERRRMMNKERNRRRKRLKVLERRQKRRDWIMKQIELGNMTKEHLELVYSRKKLPYEKKGNQVNDFSNYPVTISSQMSHNSTITVQQPGSTMSGLMSDSVILKKDPKNFSTIDSHHTYDDLSGVTSVVVTDLQHPDLNDENIVSVSSIPGVVITGRLHGTHQIIVEGDGEEYTPEQIDLIVKAVDDLEVNSWKIASSPKSYSRGNI